MMMMMMMMLLLLLVIDGVECTYYGMVVMIILSSSSSSSSSSISCVSSTSGEWHIYRIGGRRRLDTLPIPPTRSARTKSLMIATTTL